MNRLSKIFVAGHNGLLGAALLRVFKANGYMNLLVSNKKALDLTDKHKVDKFFLQEKPEYVLLAAGLTGGIMANKTFPADFLRINSSIQNNIFQAAHDYQVQNLVFYGSSCMYPKDAPQPMAENCLLSGPIEQTSEAYAIAKISGIISCRSYNSQYLNKRYIALVPNSMYGPNDHFDPERSHVVSALLRKIHDAKKQGLAELTLWGSGRPRREFVYVDDVAQATLFMLQNADQLENTHYNIGTGIDHSIKELAELIAQTVGYTGKFNWDTSKPDGTYQKLLDCCRIKSLGWQPQRTFEQGIKETYDWFLQNEQGK
jgi:GDP-L-fucose synthase